MTATDPALEALYAKLRAAPHDDAPRLALADELTRRGDPRGEFITLQLRARDGTAPRKDVLREKALLKAHAREWAPGLGELFTDKSFRYERGFLSEVRPKAPTSDQLRALATSDAWATVERLSLASWASPRKLPAYSESVEVAGELLASERLPALRSASVHAAAVLMKMARSERPLGVEAIECSGWFHLYCYGFELTRADLEALGATRSLPRLRRLAVSTHTNERGDRRGPARFEGLFRGPTFAALEHFGLTDVGNEIPAWLDALSAMAAPSKTFEVVYGSGSWLDRQGVALTFTRDDSGRFSKLDVTIHADSKGRHDWANYRVVNVLSTLDRELCARATLTVSPGGSAALSASPSALKVAAMLGG